MGTEPNTLRWHARIGQAVAAGTVPWQHASLAAGLLGLVVAANTGYGAHPAFYPIVAFLHLALLIAALWLGLRLRIDARLFETLAGDTDPEGFDRAMHELGLMLPEKLSRPMAARVAGLLRLSRLLALVVVAQLIFLAVAGAPLWR